MRLRVFVALTVALLSIESSVAAATVVRDAAVALPSSFSYSGNWHRSGLLVNPATAPLAEAAQIFPRFALAGAPSGRNLRRGITTPLTDFRIPSLEELVVIASVDPSRYVRFEGRATESEDASSFLDFHASSRHSAGTVRDLARALLNRRNPDIRNESMPDDDNNVRNYGTGGYEFFRAILNSELDREFVSTVTEVVTPSVTPEGVVALNFLGMRDFAFFLSPATNKIQVVDFSTGTTLTVSQGTQDYVATPTVQNSVPQQPQQPQLKQDRTQPRVSLVRLLARIRQIALHPLTFLCLALIAIFAFVFHVSRRVAQ